MELSRKEIDRRQRAYFNMQKKLKEVKEKNGVYRGELKNLKKDKKKVEEENEKLRKENEELKNKLRRMAEVKEAKRPRFPEQNYSLSEHEKKQNATVSPKRKKTKISRNELEVDREENVFPEGFPPEECILEKSRTVIHIREGKKEVVRYYIYRALRTTERGQIKNVFSKSGYGIEVGLIAAFLVYELGLTHNQTQQIFQFFCQLDIGQSQIDSLLEKVGKEWQKEFEAISKIILYSWVVYMDETGWRVNAENCYTWIFTTMSHTLYLFGEKRNEEVLDRILPLGEFKGIGVSDCYSIYVNRFEKAQKCWPHFLRTAIRLMLLYPKKEEYQKFFEAVFKIYRLAKLLKTKESPPEEKIGRVKILTQAVLNLCTRQNEGIPKEADKDHRDFVNLQKRLVKNQDDLFTFVLDDKVDSSSNRAERGLRKVAKCRNNYQTSKSENGAKRRSVITTVLTSLRQNLPDFSCETFLQEIFNWRENGISLFEEQLKKCSFVA